MKIKSSFLLLELFLTLILLSLGWLFLSNNCYTSLQKEIDSLKKIALERVAEVSFLSIQEKIFSEKNGFEFEKIPKNREERTSHFLSPYEQKIPPFDPLLIERRFTFHAVKEKETTASKIKFLQIDLHLISLKTKKEMGKYRFSLLMKKPLQEH